jgi:hypothetical protein
VVRLDPMTRDYARVVDDRLDEAVYDHLLLDLCPTPESVL